MDSGHEGGQKGDDAVAGRLLVIHNPTAGRRRARRLAAALERLSAAGTRPTLRRTERRGDAEAIARAAAGEPGIGAVVVAGGDGTINEAINGLAGSGALLGILPLGTANVLAHELAIGDRPDAAARIIQAGRERTIRLGEVEGRRFAMMAGAGYDAWVVAAVDPAWKRRMGKAAYVVAGLRTFLVWRPRRYAVTIDGRCFTACSVVCCNGHYYGGRFVLAPAARLEDDRLHVVLFERGDRRAVLRYLVAMTLGRIHRLPDVRVVAGRTVTIVSADGAPEPVQADGDIVARLPATIAVAADATRVIAP